MGILPTRLLSVIVRWASQCFLLARHYENLVRTTIDGTLVALSGPGPRTSIQIALDSPHLLQLRCTHPFSKI